MKRLSITLVSIIFLLLLPEIGYTQTMQKYYSSLFKRWGFNASVILAEDIGESFTPSERVTIIICEGNLPTDCTATYKNGVFFIDHEADTITRNKVFEALKPQNVGGNKIYKIPLSLLTTPKMQELVEAYFKGAVKSEKSLYEIQTDVSQITNVYNEVNESDAFQLLKYLVVIAIVSVGVYEITKRVNTTNFHWKFLSENAFKTTGGVFENLANIISTRKYKWLACSLALYIPYLILYILRLQYIGGLMYAISTYKLTLTPSGMYDFIIAGNKSSMIMVLLNVLVFAIIALAITPTLLTATKNVWNLLYRTSISRDMRNALTIIGIIIGLYSTTLVPVQKSAPIIGFAVSLCVVSLWYSKVNEEAERRGGKDTKICLLATIFSFILFGGLFAVNGFKVAVPYKYENLFSEDKKVITLPYIKEFKEDTLLTEELYSGNSIIFANEYPIYHPSKRSVEVKGISDYNPDADSVILAKNKREFLSKVITRHEIISSVQSEEFSSIFTIHGFKYWNIETESPYLYQISVSFDCTKEPKSGVIALDVVYSSMDSLSGNIQGESKDYLVMDFPGCRNNSNAENFSFRLPTDYASKKELRDVAFRLSGEPASHIKNASIVTDNKEATMRFFPSWAYEEGVYNISYVNHKNTDEFSVYVVGSAPSYDYALEETLSATINNLVLKEKINDKVLIWSSDPDTIVKTNYD